MRIQRVKLFVLSLLCLTFIDTLGNHLIASESINWPEFRGNSARNPVRSTETPEKLYPVWRYSTVLPPNPAWDAPGRFNRWMKFWLSSAWNYDDSYQTVSVGDKVYFCSSSDSIVRCIDLKTGNPLWTFEMEAPGHLAPAVSNGYCYVPSDDGYLYCLNAATGKLKWKYSPQPGAARIPCDGHIISVVPMRCGVAVADGIVYLAAGLFPLEGTYLCALNADNGKEKFVKKIFRSPNGYIALTKDAIIVPNGRAPAVAYSRASGEKIGVSGKSGAARKKVNGGAYAVTLGTSIALGPSEAGTMWLYRNDHWDSGWRFSGLQLLDDSEKLYLLEKSGVSALDRKAFLEKHEIRKKWQVRLNKVRTMIKIGDALIIGGNKFLVLLDSATGKEKWKTKTDGEISGLAYNNGYLIASSTTGTIYCFSRVSGPNRGLIKRVPPNSLKQNGLSKFINGLFKRKKGYVLVVNPADFNFPCSLASGNEMNIVCVVDSEKAATKGRLAAFKYGLSGRITYHVLSAKEKLPYRSYIFNAILFDNRTSGKIKLKECMRLQRPCGGVMVVIAKKGHLPVTSDNFQRKTGRLFAVAWNYRGKVSGGGEWTHPYATSGNTLCSGSTMNYGRTGILWFGRPGPHDMPDRHTKGTPPVYANGRLYVSGTDKIFAIDAYNGTILWEKDLEDVGRVITPRNTGNMVASDSGVYVAYKDKCDFMDGDTGKVLHSFSTGSSNSEWGYVGLSGSVLVGSATQSGVQYRPSLVALDSKKWFDSDGLCFYGYGTVACSQSIFAYDIKTNRILWKYEAVIPNPAITMDDESVYFIQISDKKIQPGRVDMKTFLKSDTEIVALNLKTGRVLWKKPIDLKKAQWTLYLSVSDGVVLAVSSGKMKNSKNKDKPHYFLNAFECTSGNELWNSAKIPSRNNLKGDHGELNQHPVIIGDIVMGDGFAFDLKKGSLYKGWKWKKGRKCGLPTASRNLIFSRNSGALVTQMANVKTGKSRSICFAARSGCWVNVIPAGGLVLVPEATSGCTCGYAVQTSRAFIPLGKTNSK
jgi:outer membrane protein assembly factor BamB